MSQPIFALIQEILATAELKSLYATADYFQLTVTHPTRRLTLEAFHSPEAFIPGNTRTIVLSHYYHSNGEYHTVIERMTSCGVPLSLTRKISSSPEPDFIPVRWKRSGNEIICDVGAWVRVEEFAPMWARLLLAQGVVNAVKARDYNVVTKQM